MAPSPLVLAVDIGGTKLAAALVDRHGQEHWSERVPTPASDDPEVVWQRLAGLIGRAPEGAVVAGVGCGGPMTDDNEKVSPLNIPGWRDFPLRSRLAALTGLDVALDNDAKALALAEGWKGAAVGRRAYLAMVVSTGVGGGIVLDGRLLEGRDRNAGHIGHVVVEPDGRFCACGGRGCLEAEASGLNIEVVTGAPAADAPPQVVARTGRFVGRAVASVANLLDLDLATVAGSVALGYGEPFFEAARAEAASRACLAFSRGLTIVPSSLGARGPIVGAAALGWRRHDGEVPCP